MEKSLNCAADGCLKPREVGSREYCRAHYQRLFRAGLLERKRAPRGHRSQKKCNVDGCEKIVGSGGGKGYCVLHYQRWKKRGSTELRYPPPSEALKAEIISQYQAGESIYYIGKLHDIVSETVRKWLTKWGVNIRLPGFQPGHQITPHKERKTDGVGYIFLYRPDHPNAYRGFVREHRLVMEEKIGRLLTKEEIVHHINNDPSDNRLENLELTLRADHSREHRVAQGRIKNPNNRYKVITLACECCGRDYKRKIIKLCRPCRAPT